MHNLEKNLPILQLIMRFPDNTIFKNKVHRFDF